MRPSYKPSFPNLEFPNVPVECNTERIQTLTGVPTNIILEGF